MFILRIIKEKRANVKEPFSQVITNYELGNSYYVLKNGFTKKYDAEMESKYPYFNKDEFSGIVCAQNELHFFIEKNTDLKTFTYFVMTENGRTFERL